MIQKLETESAKNYQAICDYWRLGPGRNIQQLVDSYKAQENPPAKTYLTLKEWSKKYDWENRIIALIEEQQLHLEKLYTEELLKNAQRRYLIIDDMFDVAQQMEVDTDMTSIAQATGLYKALLDAIGKTFNLDAPDKIALTDPSGRKEYQSDISELLKLADAAKRRPE